MTSRLFGSKPLPEPMLACCQLYSSQQTSKKFEVGILSFSFKKMHLKLPSAKMAAILSRGDKSIAVSKRAPGCRACAYKYTERPIHNVLMHYQNKAFWSRERLYQRIFHYSYNSMEKSFLAPVPLTIFRSNSKFDQNLQCSGWKCTPPITTQFYTRHVCKISLLSVKHIIN